MSFHEEVPKPGAKLEVLFHVEQYRAIQWLSAQRGDAKKPKLLAQEQA
jgi:hypothetical protein